MTTTTSTNRQDTYVPNDFRGTAKARLRKVFTESEDRYTLVFQLLDTKHKGCTVRREIDFSNPKRFEYYRDLYEQYDVKLTKKTVECLVGQHVLLRFSEYQDDGVAKQTIWVNAYHKVQLPAVKVTIDLQDLTMRFDINADLPEYGEEYFRIWLGLRIWVKQQMKTQGLPAEGYYVYPHNLYTQ